MGAFKAHDFILKLVNLALSLEVLRLAFFASSRTICVGCGYPQGFLVSDKRLN